MKKKRAEQNREWVWIQIGICNNKYVVTLISGKHVHSHIIDIISMIIIAYKDFAEKKKKQEQTRGDE